MRLLFAVGIVAVCCICAAKAHSQNTTSMVCASKLPNITYLNEAPAWATLAEKIQSFDRYRSGLSGSKNLQLQEFWASRPMELRANLITSYASWMKSVRPAKVGTKTFWSKDGIMNLTLPDAANIIPRAKQLQFVELWLELYSELIDQMKSQGISREETRGFLLSWIGGFACRTWTNYGQASYGKEGDKLLREHLKEMQIDGD